MNERARALLLAGVTLFGAGHGSGYLVARSNAPVAPVVVQAPVSLPAMEPVAVPFLPPPPVIVKPTVPAPRTASPPPRVRPPAPIVRERRERPQAQKKRTTTTQRAPTAAECALMRMAGEARVLREGRARGYSTTQINGALRHCGL